MAKHIIDFIFGCSFLVLFLFVFFFKQIKKPKTSSLGDILTFTEFPYKMGPY